MKAGEAPIGGKDMWKDYYNKDDMFLGRWKEEADEDWTVEDGWELRKGGMKEIFRCGL
jgi:hypothetical protein